MSLKIQKFLYFQKFLNHKFKDLSDGKKGTEQKTNAIFFKARKDYKAKNKNQISFPSGAIIQLIGKNDNYWATGTIIGNDDTGMFPLNCVKVSMKCF